MEVLANAKSSRLEDREDDLLGGPRVAGRLEDHEHPIVDVLGDGGHRLCDGTKVGSTLVAQGGRHAHNGYSSPSEDAGVARRPEPPRNHDADLVVSDVVHV